MSSISSNYQYNLLFLYIYIVIINKLINDNLSLFSIRRNNRLYVIDNISQQYFALCYLHFYQCVCCSSLM